MTLTPEQQHELEHILTTREHDAEAQRNARVLLMYAGGEETRDIAEAVGLSASRTRYWRKVFERFGMRMFDADFVPPRRAGAVPRSSTPLLTEEQARELRALRDGQVGEEQRRRIDLILNYAAGKNTEDVAREAGLSPSRARYWRKAFERDGMAVFSHDADERPSSTRANRDKAPPAGDARPSGSEAKRKSTPKPSPRPVKQVRRTPGLQSADTLADAARKVLRLHFEEMVAQGQSEELGNDDEVVHRMRVATRRMRSAFDVFDGAFTEKTVRQFRKPLKRTGRVLGAVRDLDVLLQHMHAYAAELPEADAAAFAPLIAAWEEERELHLAELRDYLHSDDYREFCDRFSVFVHSDDKGAAAAEEVIPGVTKHIAQLAPLMIMRRYTDILAFGPVLETATLDCLHALRIQCKKLRYTMEFLQELLGPEAKKLIKHVTGMQDYLGHLQDDQTAGEIITQFVQGLDQRQAHLPLAERLNPAPLLTYLADRQLRKHSLLTGFPEAWTAFIEPESRKRLLHTLLHIH